MRTDLSTIQQTLMPEASSVLEHSIEEARRRNHSQTTPLHVASTLLSAQTSFLRQACIRSHPNSSHPLQCRALELCFSVALERLPTSTGGSSQGTDGGGEGEEGVEPSISNALMAALKRAQAHQRRGCPEQQQQPLLAVKVELKQLIISILDDPSVSRVMREASFSSPAVKATIEQSFNNPTSSHHHHHQNLLICPEGLNQPMFEHHRKSLEQFQHPYLNPRISGNLGSFGGVGPRMLVSPASPVSQSGAIIASPVSMENRNMYLNPRLQQGGSGQSGSQRNEEVNKVMDIFLRTKKRNPVLVGEGEPVAVVKELLRRIEKSELCSEGCFNNVEVVQFNKEFITDKDRISAKINELGGLIESKISNGSVIVDLGDLKWLVDQPLQKQVVSEASKAVVVEMGTMLARFFGNNDCNKIWLIGTATCETYLRCQVYHPTMENDWDLQAVPISSRSPLAGIFPRPGSDRLLGNPWEHLNGLNSFPTPTSTLSSRLSESSNATKNSSCCPQCLEKYEEELADFAKEFENSCYDEKLEATPTQLPQWLRNAKIQDNRINGSDFSQGKDKKLHMEVKSQELLKKWRDTCLRLHPNFHHIDSSQRTASPVLSLPNLDNSTPSVHQPFTPKLLLTKNLGELPKLNECSLTLRPPMKEGYVTLRPSLSANPVLLQPPRNEGSTPGSPVRTELVLGQKVSDGQTKTNEGNVKDSLGCIPSELQKKPLEKFSNPLDADTFKKLIKGLMEKAWWQADAASGVASAVTRCRLGNGKQLGGGSRGDIWLLFAGPDWIGKRKMASVLSDQICGTSPVMISLGLRRHYEETDMNIRGKTALDRITEAIRRNPFSVIMIEDIDEADFLVRGSIKRAIDRGRLADSHGREISLGNVIFVVTGNWSTISYEEEGNWIAGKKGNNNWQLRLTSCEKGAKRRANWLHDEDRPTNLRKDLTPGLSFDLNQAADIGYDRAERSHNLSDLTMDHEEDHDGHDLDDRRFTITALPRDLVNSVDDTIVFRPVDFSFIGREIKKTIIKKFSTVVDEKISLQVDDAALEKIIRGLLHGKASLERWVENVLDPSFNKLESLLESVHDDIGVRLALDTDTDFNAFSNGDKLPDEIKITANKTQN
ncbi:hypothetical protein Leryth_013417 [Lithospermum erythrorhizon]|nr:hypothetical protein Leryth_013417 [Lithospermum erythrorhizon]